MRLFVGIPLPPEVVRQLSALCARLRSPADGLRWPAPETWHITLQFLGSTSLEQYGCLALRLRGIQMEPIRVELESPDIFDRAGVFFAGVRLTPGLLALEERILAATQLCGFAADTRPYRPHITLARGQRQNIGALKTRVREQPDGAKFVAREFCMYESFLESIGARYEVRERFGLDAASRMSRD